MDNKKFNEQRYNRRKQLYRFTLGFQQMINYPVLNLIWVLLAIGIVYFMIGERKLLSKFDIYSKFTPIIYNCKNIILIILTVICIIGFLQFIGYIFAIRDEADMSLVFGDKHDIKNQPPILIYKKSDRKTGVTKREFYTTVPMELWLAKKEAICDRLDVHLIGDMSYGGKKKNKGYQIYFESANGRKPKERGVLYDDMF